MPKAGLRGRIEIISGIALIGRARGEMDSGIAFQVGALTVRWYGLIIAAAVIVGYLVAYFRAQSRGDDTDHVGNILIVSMIAAIIGARIYYVLFSFNSYRGNLLEMAAIWHGGLAIHGGLIGGILAVIIYTRYKKLDFWYWADLLAPSLILGQAIGRWGNYFNQEAFGYPTDLPWAIFIPPEKRPPEFAGAGYFHPTFLYESLWDLLGFILLIFLARYQRRHRDRLPDGTVLLAYGIFYSAGRFAIESLRTDSLYLQGLRAAQVAGVVAIVLCVILFIIRRRSLSKPVERSKR